MPKENLSSISWIRNVSPPELDNFGLWEKKNMALGKMLPDTGEIWKIYREKGPFVRHSANHQDTEPPTANNIVVGV